MRSSSPTKELLISPGTTFFHRKCITFDLKCLFISIALMSEGKLFHRVCVLKKKALANGLVGDLGVIALTRDRESR